MTFSVFDSRVDVACFRVFGEAATITPPSNPAFSAAVIRELDLEQFGEEGQGIVYRNVFDISKTDIGALSSIDLVGGTLVWNATTYQIDGVVREEEQYFSVGVFLGSVTGEAITDEGGTAITDESGTDITDDG